MKFAGLNMHPHPSTSFSSSHVPQYALLLYTCIDIILIWDIHYENMPIQIHVYRNFTNKDKEIIKNSDNFHISAQNIDCGYSLEPPRRGGSNEYL